ncbi:MAG TPA: oxidoreductase, partial [Polyangiales bacterium]|nr:oxidoreductase [Polyangiales bacterium]
MDERPQRALSLLHGKHELSRRNALKVLAGLVASAQAACIEQPGDVVRPYARTQGELVPGRARAFATTMLWGGFGVGLVVESHEGRPTKVEGNPDHPASDGATSAQQQASVLDLYDPDRAKSVSRAGEPASWDALFAQLERTPGPRWLVAPSASSPLEQRLLAQLASRADTHVVTTDRYLHQNVYRGAELAFGRAVEPQLDLARCDIVA